MQSGGTESFQGLVSLKDLFQPCTSENYRLNVSMEGEENSISIPTILNITLKKTQLQIKYLTVSLFFLFLCCMITYGNEPIT